MAEAVKMPKLGLQMTVGVITKWLVAEGDTVSKGDPIFSIETDKLVSDVESTASGVVLKIVAKEGDELEIMEPCCYIGQPGEAIPDGDNAAGTPEAGNAPVAGQPQAAAAPPQAAAAAPRACGRLLATPYARKLAHDFGLTLEEIPGTGPNGRIQRDDVLAWQEKQRVKITPVAKKLAAEYGVDCSDIIGSGPEGRIQKADVQAAYQAMQAAPDADAALEEDTFQKPMSTMRKTVGRRLLESKQNIPHVYFEDEVDATAMIEARKLFQDAALRKNGTKLTYNDMILKAVAQALSEFQDINAQTDGQTITYFRHVHLGMAVAVPTGLIVPVIRRAEEKTMAEISREASGLAERAKAGKLSMDEFTGGTFTVSNLGGYGLEGFQAIINPPESGILAVGSIKEKAVAVDHQLAVRPMMKIVGSFDHRLIDGALAARFMVRVKELLESAVALFF